MNTSGASASMARISDLLSTGAESSVNCKRERHSATSPRPMSDSNAMCSRAICETWLVSRLTTSVLVNVFRCGGLSPKATTHLRSTPRHLPLRETRTSFAICLGVGVTGWRYATTTRDLLPPRCDHIALGVTHPSEHHDVRQLRHERDQVLGADVRHLDEITPPIPPWVASFK